MILKESLSIFSGFSGGLGDIVIYRHRNRICARRKPAGDSKPPSPAQLAQQERIAAIAIFYHSLKAAGLYVYWQKASEGIIHTGYNLLIKNNLPAFNGEGCICDFSKLMITTGEIPLPDNLALEEGEQPGEWKLSWKNTPYTSGTKEDDRLKVVVMKDCETFEVEEVDTGDCRRKDGEAVFSIPERLKEYTHLYVIFCSHTDGKSSKSRYFQII